MRLPIKTTVDFSSLKLNPSLLKSIEEEGFKQLSPIQEMTLEPILSGKDIFAQAETGSGKTGAFVIPILEQILRDEKSGQIEAHESRYAVLSPTRELAQQTHTVFQKFGKQLGIESCCIVGGESMQKQKTLIGKGVHVLVATPGRFADLIKQKVIALEHCKGVVFDEADRLFDMGFKKDIEFILSKAAPDRQLIMLSATSNMDVLRTAYKFKSHPEELKLNEDSLLVEHVVHKLAMVSREEKFSLLVNLLREKEDVYAIVFCNTQLQTHTVAEWLIQMGFKAKPISGRMPQNKRTALMKDFRSKDVTILVCTDVAARGLDIKNVNLVINYDLPQEAANYVHRIGRTGRAGEEGHAVSFCAHEDCEFLDPIYDLIESKIDKMDLQDSDFATDICHKPRLDRKTLTLMAPRGNQQREGRQRDKYEGKKQGSQRKDERKRDDHKTQGPDRQTDRQTDRQRPQASSVNKETREVRPRIDRRFFEFEGHGVEAGSSKAMAFFKLEDESLLGHEILEKGRRKFFFFGPQKLKVKYYIKPIYKKLLLPFLINIIKKSNLSLFVKVSFKAPNLFINFSGKDERLLVDNSFELLNAFEQLVITYLQSRITLQRSLKIQLKCAKSSQRPVRKNDDEELIKMAEALKKKVLSSQKAQRMKALNPGERRVIHQHFESDKDVKTSSIGDGRFKKVELSLRA
jgi:ATP-dependent RNA helicase RhlE